MLCLDNKKIVNALADVDTRDKKKKNQGRKI